MSAARPAGRPRGAGGSRAAPSCCTAGGRRRGRRAPAARRRKISNDGRRRRGSSGRRSCRDAGAGSWCHGAILPAERPSPVPAGGPGDRPPQPTSAALQHVHPGRSGRPAWDGSPMRGVGVGVAAGSLVGLAPSGPWRRSSRAGPAAHASSAPAAASRARRARPRSPRGVDAPRHPVRSERRRRYPGGGVFGFGTTTPAPPVPATLNAPVVAMATTADGKGVLAGRADGGVFASATPPSRLARGHTLQGPVVAMAATPDGKGYWLVRPGRRGVRLRRRRLLRLDGGQHLNQPIVGMAATLDGPATGWWRRTAGYSPSATPSSTARSGGQPLNGPSSAWRHPRRRRLLAGRRRRRDLRLRRRPLRRLDGRPP